MIGIDMDHLRTWLGRTETVTEQISVPRANKLAATLNRDDRPGKGDPLPQLWHWLYFTPHAAQSELGADGHPRRGGLLPPVPLPRRMWAGGRLTFHQPLRLGEDVTRTSEIITIAEKSGAQGALVFVTLRHRLTNSAGLAIEEEQDIVYRAAASTARPAALSARLPSVDWRRAYPTDPVLLFRYSAITFNGHRIHYDLPYATQEEGYPGLVVQGPLTATLLLDAYQRETGEVARTYSFRGQAPLFGDDTIMLCGRRTGEGGDLWAEGPGGYLAMSAKVTSEAGHAD
ncbi:MAG: MaoC family dehydratase N-terminal domain-containing protein [Opitutaceae bacterium]|nr:MaoC family dehydratase N-terminal domain-containing protein [Opitutaceae bacterium]